MSNLDSISLAYLAGLIDGEGTIYAQTNAAGIKVSMTSQAAPLWAYDLLGGGHTSTHHKAANKPVYTWTFQRQADLLVVLPRLIPFMIVKRRKAFALLDLTLHKQHKPYPREASFPAWKAERDRLVEALKSWSDA